MRYVTTRDGVELYVKTWGQGRPVILLHGWPLSSDTFDDLALVIANAGMRAIAYDRRGFGRSEQPWGGYDYDTLTDDLADVIKATDASRATLLGFSMGGGEVARYMSRYGGSDVTQAVLVASVVPYLLKTTDNPNGVDQSVFDEIGAGIRNDRASYWASFFKQFYGSGLLSSPVSDEVIEWSRALAMQASLKATLACAEAFATTDFREDLGAFNVPTLLIHGTDDKIVPIDTASRQAVAGIRGARLIEYGGPHGLLASNKDQLAKDVLTFLTEAPARLEASARRQTARSQF
jgi:pimeloyl-ACP methyl ester carboxylesterase